MTRERLGFRLVLGAIVFVVGGQIAAYALGQTPERFFLYTLPAVLGAMLGVALVLVVLVQLSRR